MKILKRWSVLDCRTTPALSYGLLIVRRDDLSIALLKRIDKRTVTFYANPNATVKMVLDVARLHIQHIRKHSCIVSPLRRIKKA